MTPEELAVEFEAKAEICADLRSIQTGDNVRTVRLGGKREAYAHCAALIRQHLCTPNPLHDAAPDMLAALEGIAHGYLPDHIEMTLVDLRRAARAAITRAKGLPNV